MHLQGFCAGLQFNLQINTFGGVSICRLFTYPYKRSRYISRPAECFDVIEGQESISEVVILTLL